MAPNRRLHEENRISWNAATEAHNSHKGDQAAFFREGSNTLHAEERELLGDIRGLSVVHLQCNSGQDTLSLARLGAAVTGVDISDTAIEFARKLSKDSGIPATFHRADVYDWLEEAAREEPRFDVAFSSYGALVWLSDLSIWARGIERILKPRGRVVLVDFHPVQGVLGDDWTLKYPYSSFGEPKPLSWQEGIGDYVAAEMRTLDPEGRIHGVQDFHNPHPHHEFAWGIGDIVTALLDAGLTLTTLREYPYSNAALLPGTRPIGMGRFVPPAGVPPIPLMYGITGRKEGG
ncbi:MAG: class I SAM-dependent methyltransferase [Chloroflexota bacterium]|nr:class I SAM-dependent methyltransferase [Chloroflexota bacterium]